MRNSKFNTEYRQADYAGKKSMQEKRLAEAKNDDEKACSLGTLMALYFNDAQDDKMKAALNAVLSLVPKRPIARLLKFSAEMTYYGSYDDYDSCVRCYESNSELVRELWNEDLVIKFGLPGLYYMYVQAKGDYEKALELANLNSEMRERASMIDEEQNDLACIDYTEIYFKMGNTEKAAG